MVEISNIVVRIVKRSGKFLGTRERRKVSSLKFHTKFNRTERRNRLQLGAVVGETYKLSKSEM